MKFKNVRIADITSVHPDEYYSSNDIEKMLAPIYKRLKLSEGRLEFITGVSSRGSWSLDTLPSDISTMAAKKLINKIDINKNDIDLLIHSSVCRDQDEPSTTSFVHKNLNLPAHTLCFDISNACLGMLSSLNVAASMIEAGSIKTALIVSGENNAHLLKDTIEYLNSSENLSRKDIKGSLASLTIGSAGAAIFLTHKDYKINHKWSLEGLTTTCDTQASNLCIGKEKDGVLLMNTDSEALLNAGVALGKKNWDSFISENSYDFKLDKVIMHQVGSAHRQRILEALELNGENEFTIFKKYGNSGSASIISCLDLSIEENFLDDRNVILLGIGSGLHSTTTYLKRLG